MSNYTTACDAIAASIRQGCCVVMLNAYPDEVAVLAELSTDEANGENELNIEVVEYSGIDEDSGEQWSVLVELDPRQVVEDYWDDEPCCGEYDIHDF